MDPATAAAGAVTVNNAIQQIKPLLTELIQRVKDRDTASLVSQIQAHDQTIQAAYFDAKQDAINLASENFELKRSHSEAMDNLVAANRKKVTELEEVITRLNAAQRQPEPQSAPQLGEVETRVLGIIASAEDGASPQELARILGKQLGMVDYCLDTLESSGFVEHRDANISRGAIWRITKRGLAYAAKNNLIGNHPPGLPRRQNGPIRA